MHRLAHAFDLLDGEVDVGLLGRSEARRSARAEPRQGQRRRIVAVETLADAIPQPLGVRHTVHEDRAHREQD
jgi:hypothetical protein